MRHRPILPAALWAICFSLALCFTVNAQTQITTGVVQGRSPWLLQINKFVQIKQHDAESRERLLRRRGRKQVCRLLTFPRGWQPP